MVACLKSELALAHTFALTAQVQPDKASYLRREAERVLRNALDVTRALPLDRADVKALDAAMVSVRIALGPDADASTAALGWPRVVDRPLREPGATAAEAEFVKSELALAQTLVMVAARRPEWRSRLVARVEATLEMAVRFAASVQMSPIEQRDVDGEIIRLRAALEHRAGVRPRL